MELRDFVSNALVQIIQGVKDAQENFISYGALVSPRVVNIKGRVDQQSSLMAENGEPIREVQFDVVVMVTKDSEREDGIGASTAGSLTVGTQSDSLVSGNAVSRIKFRVPITLPVTD